MFTANFGNLLQKLRHLGDIRRNPPCHGRMYARRGHTTPSISENDVVIKKCNLIEIKFFYSNRDSVFGG